MFNATCGGDELRIAWAFQRRSTLGNSLTPQPYTHPSPTVFCNTLRAHPLPTPICHILRSYDTLWDVFLSFISVLTPLRFLTLCNCTCRAVKGITTAHFSVDCHVFDVEAFFADLRFANQMTVRLQRSRSLFAAT